MGRPRRSDQVGGWFHVLNRGVARGAVFASDADRVEFGRLIGVAHDRFGVVVHAYCLMGNHYHIVVECPDGMLSEAMHLVGSVYVRHANERMDRDGPLFRDRFYAKPVRDDAYLLRLVRYVHRNPLAFLRPEALVDYRWSSLRTYLGMRRRPVWMRTDEVLTRFGGIASFRSAMFDPDDVTEVDLAPASCLAAIDMLVEEYSGQAPRQRVARTVAVLLLDHVDPPIAAALTAELGYPTPGALSSARTRARRRIEAEPRLAAVVRAAERFVR